jgi:hypothetical protein
MNMCAITAGRSSKGLAQVSDARNATRQMSDAPNKTPYSVPVTLIDENVEFFGLPDRNKAREAVKSS